MPRKKQDSKPQLKLPSGYDLVSIDDLVFDEYNPRFISPEEREALKASLLEHGLVLPIIAQRGTNRVIGGHQRLDVLIEMREQGYFSDLKVYATFLDKDDASARRLNVALNRISGDFDEYKLAELFKLIGVADEPDDALIQAMGFERDEVAALLESTRDPDEIANELSRQADGVKGDFGRSITLSIEFESVEERDETKASLRAICKSKGIKAGSLLLGAIQKGRLGKVPTDE